MLIMISAKSITFVLLGSYCSPSVAPVVDFAKRKFWRGPDIPLLFRSERAKKLSPFKGRFAEFSFEALEGTIVEAFSARIRLLYPEMLEL